MGKFNKTRILDLIKTDLLIISGGKKGGGTLFGFIIMGFVFLMGGFIISPAAGCIIPTITGAIIVSEIASKEHNSGCSRMYSVLPVARHELVQSRFVFAIGINLVLCIAVYLLMLLSMKLKLYVLISEGADILGMMSERSGGALTEFGAFNIAYSLGASAGMAAAASALRGYFKRGAAYSEEMSDPLGEVFGKKKKMSAGEKVLVILCLSVAACFFLAMTGVINILAPLALVIQLFMQLAQAANGLMLSAVFFTMGAFSTVYNYVCSVVEFEDRDA